MKKMIICVRINSFRLRAINVEQLYEHTFEIRAVDNIQNKVQVYTPLNISNAAPNPKGKAIKIEIEN